MLGNLVLLLASSLGAAWLLYAIARLIQVRRSLKDLPKPPHSLFWGHLKLMGEISSLFPPQTYPQFLYSEIAKRYNMPGVWYLDLWPFAPPQLVVTSTDVCRDILVGRPYPVHGQVEETVGALFGPNTIVAVNGDLWRALHHIMAPSFTPMAVKSHVTTIIHNALNLHDRLLAHADEGAAFSLEEEISKTTFDITSTIVLGFSLNAQKGDDEGLPLLRDFRRTFDLSGKYAEVTNPIKKLWLWLAIRAARQRSSKPIEAELRERHRILREQKILPSGKAARSILDRLLIQRLEEPDHRNEQVLDQAFVDLMVTNLKALIGGGQGTTTDTLCFTYLCLSLYPDVVRRMREEHDRVFDPELTTTVEILTESPSKTNELEYTSAVIKETLRLFPVGFVIRQAPEGVTTIDYKGVHYPIKDFMIVLLNHATQLDPAHWPEPNEFIPDRFLESYEPKHDRYAWRPFSRGPRACTGQELAMDEMRIMLLLTARWLDFETVLGKVPAETKVTYMDWETRIGNLAFQQLKMSAAPRSEMRMKLRKTRRS